MNNKIIKNYYCGICKTHHNIEFDSDFAKNRTKFPFNYYFIHKFQSKTNMDYEKIEADVITSLYLDKDLEIRSVETHLEESSSNIISKDDSEKIIKFLSDYIYDLEKNYKDLLDKYNKLLRSINKKHSN